MSVPSVSLQGVINQLQGTAAQAAGQSKNTGDAASGESFGQALLGAVDRIDALKHTAAAQGQAFEVGQPGVSINQVMVGMAKADIGMQMGIQVRNRVVNAYKEIMNMQV